MGNIPWVPELSVHVLGTNSSPTVHLMDFHIIHPAFGFEIMF